MSVKVGSYRALVLQCSRTIGASPPVAITWASPLSSKRIRSVMPSTIAAAPRITPDLTDSTVDLPITAFGGASSTLGIRAAAAESA
jgi:hypothetical protein